ncbi:class I SAM-dependent methyltransferase [Cyanobacterium aponinum UTEX 3222]|uniref:class I SAM-dependent methyltransferase n=1 Tax=Cyanobacterium aponinum TaxID=379064 RepID=UPI003091842C|nr:class I SAM-dependent methyltransferase [Cyanobacterium aponinum UTEX 3222]
MTQSICPICEGEMNFHFSVPCDYRKPSEKKEYKVFWCSACDYGHIWDRPLWNEIKESYQIDNYYTHQTQNEQKNKKLRQNSLEEKLRIYIAWRFDFGEHLKLKEISSYLRQKKVENTPKEGSVEKLSICEIGCGSRKNLKKFASLDFDIFGVEPDEEARKVALSITDSIFSGTAEELPTIITQRKYDCVLMSHSLEHTLDINKTIRNIKSVLCDYGLLIIEIPNSKCLGFQKLKGEWPWSDIPRHLNFFTPQSLKLLLERYNFYVESTNYVGFCRHFFPTWLDIEKEIHSAFASNNIDEWKTPNYKLRSWILLLQTLLSSNETKYDSVRMIAINNQS